MTSSPKFYAGIGSRSTPDDILHLMRVIAHRLALEGWCLRSGGAAGADSAFAHGAVMSGAPAQIMLADERGKAGCPGMPFVLGERPGPVQDACRLLTLEHHPMPRALGPLALKLMDRNAMQVLGPNLDKPSSFVVCWTPDGAIAETSRATGGTGQAIRIAARSGIPVFNLAREDHLDRLRAFANPDRCDHPLGGHPECELCGAVVA